VRGCHTVAPEGRLKTYFDTKQRGLLQHTSGDFYREAATVEIATIVAADSMLVTSQVKRLS
jgi:hypothetical protein